MKQTKLFLIAFLVLTAGALSSCSKDDDGENGTTDAVTYIRFSAAGANYDFKDIISAESLALTLNGNNGEGITNPGDTQISIWLPVEPELGTFDVNDESDGTYIISFSSEALGFDFDFAHNGSITVTEITDNFIIGTFSGAITSDSDETNTITLTNGSFKGERF